MNIERFDYNPARKQTTFLASSNIVELLMQHLRSAGYFAGSLKSQNGISEVIVTGRPEDIAPVLKEFCPLPDSAKEKIPPIASRNLRSYLKIIKTGEIARCVCYEDKKATIVSSSGEIHEVALGEVAAPTTDELNLYFGSDCRGRPAPAASACLSRRDTL